MRLTELEKTIMLVFLVFTKGSVDKHLSEEFILSKFVPRQRKLVRRAIRRLIKNSLLDKKPKELNYKFTKQGLKRASRILHEGAKLWKR
jgi:hypothetical protein